jgi:hypothetical protein
MSECKCGINILCDSCRVARLKDRLDTIQAERDRLKVVVDAAVEFSEDEANDELDQKLREAVKTYQAKGGA